jgi:RND family efflux transporter MFP subunit
MPLDQSALESLRDDSRADSDRYRSTRSASRRRRWLMLGGLLALLGLAVAWRVLNGPVPVQTVTVEAPEGGANGAVLNASGYVVARRIATVSSKVTGRITQVLFEEGASVKEGQLLARLDGATAGAEYDVAAKGLESARRNAREIEVRLGDARRTLERNRSLAERRLVAQSVVDASAADVAALQARLAATGAEVDVSRSRVALSRQGLNDLEVRAPFSGVVISKDAQPGETVSPMSAGGGYTRTGIATIVDMESLEIEVDVNEAYINRVIPAQKVEGTLDAYPDWKIPAHVINIVPTADRQKATVRVRIALDQRDPRILPDMGIKVSFLPAEGAVVSIARPTIPQNALVSTGTDHYVWVVRDGKVARQSVKSGPVKDDQVPVLEGLEGGEVLVVDPPQRLKEGRSVELRAGK